MCESVAKLRLFLEPAKYNLGFLHNIACICILYITYAKLYTQLGIIISMHIQRKCPCFATEAFQFSLVEPNHENLN